MVRSGGAALWANKAAVIHMMASTSKPVLYDRTSLVRDGALMSYEARIVDPFRIWANQLLLILDGVDAATIPVERPSQFELALNLDAIASDNSCARARACCSGRMCCTAPKEPSARPCAASSSAR